MITWNSKLWVFTKVDQARLDDQNGTVKVEYRASMATMDALY